MGFLKKFTKQEISWMMYDWANSAHSVIVVTILPIFFDTVAGYTADSVSSMSTWGFATSLAMAIVALSAPTHFLVIPKAHIGSCGEISPENSAVVAHAFEVIAQVTKDLGVTDFRVVSNCGEQAGQSVHHLHFHVLAGRDMTWPPG